MFATKRSFWSIAAEQLATEQAVVLHSLGFAPVNDTTTASDVPAKKANKVAKTIEIRNMRGAEYHADVVPRQSIRLHGFEHNHTAPHAYDITFKVGDEAVYGGYNMAYTGKIVSIGEKTVKINHGSRSTVLKFDDFSFRNRDFDAKKIAERNANWMD
jgi:hypothetical protein